jgi:predicted Zn-dependent protease
MTSFRTLTDPDKLNRLPERIRIREITRSMTLQEALREFRMPADRHEELAILNGMELNDQLRQGVLIKVFGQ